MPIIEVTLRPGQSLTDLALERYGAIEGLGVILNDNPDLQIGVLPGTTPIKINTVCPEITVNNVSVKALIEKRGTKVNNEKY